MIRLKLFQYVETETQTRHILPLLVTPDPLYMSTGRHKHPGCRRLSWLLSTLYKCLFLLKFYVVVFLFKIFFHIVVQVIVNVT